MPRSLLSRRRRGGRSLVRSFLIDVFSRVASRGSIRLLRNVDRPPRRSLSNELLIARGTPPNLGGEFLLQPHINVQTPVPSLQSRGGRAIKKKSPFRKGADGVVAQRLHCEMRFETSRVSDHPVCAALVASQHFINGAATPSLQGGECALPIKYVTVITKKLYLVKEGNPLSLCRV